MIGALLAAIANATGPTDYPARLNMTASELEAKARVRFNVSTDLVLICQDLQDNFNTGTFNGSSKLYNHEDGLIIGFFLGRNSKRAGLQYVPCWYDANISSTRPALTIEPNLDLRTM